MLDNYDRGEMTPPPPVSGYGGSPGLLALHSSLYATPTSRAYDIDSGIDGNDSSMPIDTQIISVCVFANLFEYRLGRISFSAIRAYHIVLCMHFHMRCKYTYVPTLFTTIRSRYDPIGGQMRENKVKNHRRAQQWRRCDSKIARLINLTFCPVVNPVARTSMTRVIG